MQQREVFTAFVEQGVEAATFIRQMPLQAAQAQVQGLGDAFGARFAFGQLFFNGIAHFAFPGQRFELGEGAFENGFVVFGQFRVGVIEVAVEVGEGELQAVFGGGKLHRRAEDFVPLLGVVRFRATQVHRQRCIVTTETIAAGAHVDRREGVDGFEGRGRVA